MNHYQIWIADHTGERHVKADTTRNRARAIMLARDWDAQGRDARVVYVSGGDGLRITETVYERGAALS